MTDLPSTIGWRRREGDSVILTWDLPNGAEHAPMLSPELQGGLIKVEAQWGDLCREIGGRHQLPDGWLQAMIWRESGGNPRAFRQETDKEGNPLHDPSGRAVTGVGLLQITSPALKKNRTDAELFDPGINIELGAGYVSYLAGRPDTKGPDGLPDFCRIAAAFNAGSVRASTMNEWGMVMTRGHVSAEVAAYNFWLTLKMSEEQKAAALAFAKNFSVLDLIPARGPLDTLPDGEDPA